MSAVSAAETQSDVLTWRVHPARERVGVTAQAVAAVGAAAWASADLMGNAWWAVFAVAFLVLTLHSYFLPTAYRIDEDGVSASWLLSSAKLGWNDIRRFQHDDRGGLLSTRRRPSARDAFQGVYLVFRNNSDEVVRRIESRMRMLDTMKEVSP